jgi:hypothetical protein
MSPCPACRRDIPIPDAACPHCGHPLHADIAPTLPPASPVDEASGPPAEQWVSVPAYAAHAPNAPASQLPRWAGVQPIWQYVLLQFCSFGLYDLIWFYRNWKLISERTGETLTPAARAIFRIFWIRSYCHELFKLAAPAGFRSDLPPIALGTAYVACALMARAADRMTGAAAFGFGVAFFAGQILAMIPVVEALNAFWSREQPDLPVRTSLSPGAVATVVIGALLWLAAIAGVFAPEG